MKTLSILFIVFILLGILGSTAVNTDSTLTYNDTINYVIFYDSVETTVVKFDARSIANDIYDAALVENKRAMSNIESYYIEDLSHKYDDTIDIALNDIAHKLKHKIENNIHKDSIGCTDNRKFIGKLFKKNPCTGLDQLNDSLLECKAIIDKLNVRY